MTQTQITNGQLTAATARLAPPNGFIAKAMADRTGPPAPPIVPMLEASAVAGAGSVTSNSNAVGSEAFKPSLILAGFDGAGKARASAFGDDEVDAAKAAAELGGFVTVLVTTPALVELAMKLPAGKVYESGKAFVPFVKAELFNAIAEHEPLVAQKPRDFTLPRGMTVVHKNILNKAVPADDRSKPKEGSTYLAFDGEAWYEAVIVEVHETGIPTLRWRDFDEEAPFSMRHEQLGLLPPELPVVE